MTRTIPTNTDDIIDSRDIIEAIAELRESRDDMTTLAALEAVAECASDYAADWQYGETLIRDSYFEDYAQQLAEDVGAIDPHAQWPMTCIDWQRAARELRMDYTAVDFDGVTYWVR